VQKNIDLIKRARVDDRHLGNGSRTPKCGIKKCFHTTWTLSGQPRHIQMVIVNIARESPNIERIAK